MSRDNSCVSEVTTAISRLRMLTSDPNDSPSQSEESNAKNSSPETECVAISSSNSFRLQSFNPHLATSSPIPSASKFKIPIVGYEVMEERARFTVFKLRIENQTTGDSWYVFRRYTDFVRLYSKLKNDFPNLKLTLPRKRWFGDNFDQNFLEERIQGLQDFVNAIITHSTLYSLKFIKDFFCLDEPPSYAETVEESRAIFEALEETIYHLRKQLKEKENEIDKLKMIYTIERNKNEELNKLLRDSSNNIKCKDSTNIQPTKSK